MHFGYRLGYIAILSLGVASCNFRPFNQLLSDDRSPQKFSSATIGKTFALAIDVINNIGSALRLENAEMTNTQISAMSLGGLNFLEKSVNQSSGVDLYLADSPAQAIDLSNMAQITPIILKGMTKTLADASVATPDDKSKMAMVSSLLKATFVAVKAQKLEPADADVEALAGKMSSSVIEAFADAKLSVAAMSVCAGSVVGTTVSHFGDIGLSLQQVSSVLETVTQGGMIAMQSNAGVKASDVVAASATIVQGAVSALSSVKVISQSQEAVTTFFGPIVKGPMNALASMSGNGMMDMASQAKTVAENVMSGAMSGLASLTTASSQNIGAAVDVCSKSVMNSVSASNNESLIPGIMSGAIVGVMAKLIDIGIKAADIGGIAASSSASVIKNVIDIVKPADAGVIMQNTANAVAFGAASALGSMGSSGVLTSAQVMQASGNITEQSVTSMVNGGQKIGVDISVSSISTLSSQMMTGMASTNSSMNLGQLTSSIDTAVRSSLGASGMNSATIDTYSTAIATTAIGDVSTDLSKKCVTAGGKWDSATLSCVMPGQATSPVSTTASDPAAVMPPQAMLNQCQSVGGQILRNATGTWACQVNGISYDQYACEQKGDIWDNIHATCNLPPPVVVVPPTDAGGAGCSSITTLSACQTANACFWTNSDANGTGGSCQSVSYCSNLTFASCPVTTGCYWTGPTNTGVCTPSYSIEQCSLAVSESVCSVKPSCGWSNGACIPVGAIDCQIYSNNSSCNSVSACYWNYNAQSCFFATKTYQNCSDLTTSNCQQTPGCRLDSISQTCVWDSCNSYSDPYSCTSSSCSWNTASSHCSAVQACSLLPQASCDSTSGCYWGNAYCNTTTSMTTSAAHCLGYSNISACSTDNACLWLISGQCGVNPLPSDATSGGTTTIQAVKDALSPLSGNYVVISVSSTLYIDAFFSHPIHFENTSGSMHPSLALNFNVSSGAAVAAYDSQPAENAMRFRFTVIPSDPVAKSFFRLNYRSSYALSPGDWQIADNNAMIVNLALPPPTAFGQLAMDNIYVNNDSVLSNPSSWFTPLGGYPVTVSKVIGSFDSLSSSYDIQVIFSDPVGVFGGMELNLNVLDQAGNPVSAKYEGGSGTNHLHFRYRKQQDDCIIGGSVILNYLDPTSLNSFSVYGGGLILDPNGGVATLDLAATNSPLSLGYSGLVMPACGGP